MKSIDEWIIGNKIKRFEKVEDYFQVFFSDGSSINLYNEVIFPESEKLFLNVTINEFILSDNELIIKLENGSSILMTMKELEYAGPEAFAFCTKDGDWVVA